MKALAISLTLAALLLPAAMPTGGYSSEKALSLCKPGFIFIELVTDRVADYIAFFEQVTDFKVSRNDGGYACLRSELAELAQLPQRLT